MAIAEVQGFADAGISLCRSQSAVTQSLQRLECILECRLVNRRQGIVMGLTKEGERFAGLARDVLLRLNHAVDALREPSMIGRVRLGVLDDFNVVDVHGALSRCLGMNQQLTLQISSDLSARTLTKLIHGELDVAMFKKTTDEVKPEGLTFYRCLRKEALHWVANKSMTFDEVSELQLVVFPEGCSYRKTALQALEMVGKSVSIAYTSVSDENVRRAISAGLGLSLLPTSAIADDHVVLDSSSGFPELPEVELILAVNSENKLFLQFAKSLADSGIS